MESNYSTTEVACELDESIDEQKIISVNKFIVLCIFTVLKEVQRFASRNRSTAVDYNPGNLASGYIILTLLARLPDPFWVGSIFAFLFLVAPFKTFSGALLVTNEVQVTEQKKFNAWQIVLLVAFGLLWGLVLIGLFIPE